MIQREFDCVANRSFTNSPNPRFSLPDVTHVREVKIRRRSDPLRREIVLRSTSRGIALTRAQLTDYCRKWGNSDSKGFNSLRYTASARLICHRSSRGSVRTWYIFFPENLRGKKKHSDEGLLRTGIFPKHSFSQSYNYATNFCNRQNNLAFVSVRGDRKYRGKLVRTIFLNDNGRWRKYFRVIQQPVPQKNTIKDCASRFSFYLYDRA